MPSIALLREFARDFVGTGAAQKPGSIALDTPASALIALATLASDLKSTRDFIVDGLGIPGAFVPAVVALTALVACIVVISSKEIVNAAGFSPSQTPCKRYSFGVWTRRLARVALMILAWVAPANWAAAIEETLPLPLDIPGMLVDAKSRAPVEGARIRVVTTDDVDVSVAGQGAESDSNGAFFVKSSRRVWRSANLVIYRDGCKPTKTKLWKRFQTSVPASLSYVDPSISPFFTFYIECPE